MTCNLPPLHPDDLLFFHEVSTAMRTIAKKYALPLRNITGGHMPESGMADFLGLCSSAGDIQLVMRATVDGQFVEHPRSPEDVWRTAAHELAHLKHFNHGAQFELFMIELMGALDNLRTPDHKSKIIDKLVKMQASRQSEAEIGNAAAAEAFAAAINRMMLEYELKPSDLDYARASDNDPIIEQRVNLSNFKIDEKKTRVAWQESLARIVARAHLCSFLLRPGSNQIWFVGTRSHALVAEYVFGTIVPLAEKMSYTEYRQFRRSIKPVNGKYERPETHGFVESWLYAFTKRLAERFDEARVAAVAEVTVDMPAGSQSTALLRLGGAMTKVNQYIDDKFKARRGAGALSNGRGNNSEGHSRGRAAANSLAIGRRAMTTTAAPKRLT
jgi:hypothetical protein